MRKLYTLLLLALSLNCFAQNKDLYFEHLNVENGLPENQITALVQDKPGYIWIGTQNGLVRYDGYQVKVYTLGSDLKNEAKDYTVTDIIEDKKDVLWVLTRSLGVFRYNREADNFTQYKPGITGAVYYDMTCVDRDNIWIRYSTADNNSRAPHLERFNTKTLQFKALPWFVTDMAKSSTGKVWFATSKGLVSFDPASGKIAVAVSAIPGLAKNALIYSLYEPPSQPGILYFGLWNASLKALGLGRFDTRNNHFNRYTHDPSVAGSLPADTVLSVYEDKQKRLWIGTYKGISLMNCATGTFKNYSPADPEKVTFENEVSEIKERPDGKLWLSTTWLGSKGLLLFDPNSGTFSRFSAGSKNPHALSVNGINGLLVDRTGQLWAGLSFGGVDRVNNLRSQFDVYKNDPGRANSYPASSPNGIVQSRDGFCWLGSTSDGLIRWKPGTDSFERIKLPAYITSGLVGVRLADRDGLLWCSSEKSKLFAYNPKTAEIDTFKDKNHFPSSSSIIYKIYEDHTGTIWIGTRGDGLFSYDKNSRKFTAWPYEKNNHLNQYKGKKLDQREVTSFYEDREGTLWIGTNLGGLNRFNRKDGTFTSFFDLTKGLSCVTDMHEDKAGRFWVGTYLSGLFLFDRKTGNSRLFAEKDGLLINDAGGMLEDKKGHLWINSDRGLSVIDPETKTFTNYTSANALPVSIDRHFVIKLTDGRFVFPALGGMTVVDPDRLQKNPYPPQVQLEALDHNDPQAKDDNPIRVILFGHDKVELPHNQNRITLNYIALHYADPANNKYAYWLEGYDHHLVQAGGQRSATYTNLSPGTYTFHVTAANSDGVWNNKGASIEIIIYPPLWLTWWAYVFYVIVSVTAVYGFVAYRSRKLMQDKRVLEHKVEVRTEEVMQQKEEIEAQRDELETAFSELKNTQSQLVQREKMASLGELTAGIAHEIQNPLNFVNNFSDVNDEMIDELKDELKSGNVDGALSLAGEIQENERKIRHHGKRADSIVKGMLEHSRTGTGEKQPININALADEYLRLSYHGLRAKDKEFNAELVTRFDPGLPPINVVPQDISRVLLNLFNNAFYAVNERKKMTGESYKPEVTVTTLTEKGNIIIKVKDNGKGIPDAIKKKIMQPFFTTKPTGEGTGLGLSLSYDIVVKGHGGTINVETEEGKGSEFIIQLPIN